MDWRSGRLGVACAAALGAWVFCARAAGETNAFPRMLYAAEGVGKILRYAADGSVDWECPAEMSRDVWQLPNGNVLFSFNRNYDAKRHDNPGGAMEVTPDRRVAFSVVTTGQVWSCQRLPDGTTLVGAASQGCLLIADAQGDVVRKIRVKNAPGHSCMRHARQLKDGHFLVAEESARAVREYAADGALLCEYALDFRPFSAVRKEDGGTVIGGQKRLVEVDASGRVVWSMSGDDIPQAGVRWFAGLTVLPNGHVFVCNAGGRATFLEIRRDKTVAWMSNTTIPSGHGIFLLGGGPERVPVSVFDRYTSPPSACRMAGGSLDFPGGIAYTPQPHVHRTPL